MSLGFKRLICGLFSLREKHFGVNGSEFPRPATASRDITSRDVTIPLPQSVRFTVAIAQRPRVIQSFSIGTANRKQYLSPGVTLLWYSDAHPRQRHHRWRRRHLEAIHLDILQVLTLIHSFIHSIGMCRMR